MHVAKWGNSLAVRLPKALVDELHLAPGDEVQVVSANKRRDRGREARPASGVSESDRRSSIGPLPEGYKFDREEANKRR